MRLRTCNSRRKRLCCKQKEPETKTFCYIVYGKKVARPVRTTYLEGNSWTVDWEVVWKEWKRSFDNYSEAIAHLTLVKLAIDEESPDWKHAIPCKIVEGMYTKSGKETITKIVRLNDECDRPPERHFSSGLPRQLMWNARQLSQRFGIPISQALEIVRGPGWRSWSPASSSGLPAMDLARMHARGVSA